MAPSLRKNAPILPNKVTLTLDHLYTSATFHFNLLGKLTLTTATLTAFDLKGWKLQSVMLIT